MKKAIKSFILLLTASALGGFIGVKYFSANESPSNVTSDANTNRNIQYVNYGSAMGAPSDFTEAAEHSIPAVVHVKTVIDAANRGSFFWDPFRDYFFGNPRGEEQRSAGSGVIISDDGYIVTNNHVINNASQVEVTLDDKRTFKAKVIGSDPSTDVALLKIDEKNLPFLNFSNSDDVKIGQWALAVGNPFNLTSTVTAGIISAKGRNISIINDRNNFPIESFIQTDAAVNPGNSGGALVDLNGGIIGINTAIASNTGTYTGYSFAIPANIVKKVTEDLLEYGTVQRGFLGVSISDIDQQIADEMKLKTMNGVFVRGTTIGGAAEAAGIKEGDIITKINNINVTSVPQLQEQVGKYRPGDNVAVTYIRNGKENTTSIVLKNSQGTTRLVKNEIDALLGAELSALSTTELQRLGIHNGVKVSKLSAGKLRSAGIKEGFIITRIDGQEVSSTDEINQLLQNKRGGILVEGLYQNGIRAYYAFGI
ncbi:MAG: Do family serine endopeptidase [Bacteroidia bacterium]|nr:Do family serine endopeptidase [Bacteroidia bacterium]MCZ2276900.1 Do family serine endopeptidase [Bacteroidia bacterium]